MKVAMILSAGRGERLKPITDAIPKALCVVNNKPLIEHHVINLAKSGFERLVVNHAYLGGKIRNYLGDGSKWGVEIVYSPEPPGGLETAGGIVKALPLLGKDPFVTVNADIYTDFDFASLRKQSFDCIHLVLVNKNPALNHHGDFGLVDNGMLTNTNREYTFPGIACYHPQVFADLKQGRYGLPPLLRSYVEDKQVTGSLFHGIWHDIGSLDRLNELISFLDSRSQPCLLNE
ncbi:MAG: nucleotidyltransferase family protein [Legionella sp.]|jgi:MurNAc alpha-1-phosphate uridylyltransferase